MPMMQQYPRNFHDAFTDRLAAHAQHLRHGGRATLTQEEKKMTSQTLNTAVITALRHTLCALAAACVTFGIFAGVVSLADDAPMAIAGHPTARTLADKRRASDPPRVADASAARPEPQVR